MAIHRLARGIEATERQTDTQLARYEWDFFFSLFFDEANFRSVSVKHVGYDTNGTE